MAIKFGNLIVGDKQVDTVEVVSTPAPVVNQPVIRETKTVDAPPSDEKISQYVEDMGVGNKINSLFD